MPIMTQINGYRFGRRQPLFLRTINFSIPKDFSANVAEAWIRSALESEPDSSDMTALETGHSHADALIYLKCLFKANQILLQDLKIPVFETPIVLRVSMKAAFDGKFEAAVWIPFVEHIAHEVFEKWLSISAQFMIDAMRLSEQADALESCYQHFHKSIALVWQQQMPGARSSVPILQASYALGIPFAHLGSGVYVLGWGSCSRIFDRSSNHLDSALGASASHHKGFAKKLMQANGIPVPLGKVFRSGNISAETLKDVTYPCVTKPVDRDRGEGVTLNINNPTDLEQGILYAGTFSSDVIVEEQIPGICHRILVANGQVIFVVKRHPRCIIGDGIHNIESLINAKNQQIRRLIPMKRLPELGLNDATRDFLHQQGLSVHDVPAQNQKVSLRPSQSTAWGGEPEVVTDMLHADNAELALRTARHFGLNCAGIDFISQDIRVPWHINGAVINEVNFAPVLGRTHDYQREGAKAYLRTTFPSLGRIPIEIYVGASLSEQVFVRHAELVNAGIRCFLCLDGKIFDTSGCRIHFADAGNMYQAVSMLRCDRRVESLIIHIVEDNSVLSHGMPIDKVNRLHCAPQSELSSRQIKLIHLIREFLDESPSFP